MSMILEETTVTEKTLELCAAIVEQESFAKLQSQIEKFLNDDEARLQYQSVHERGDELNQKQRAGVELGDTEINAFEESREQLLRNTVVTDFMSAQKQLQSIQKTITQMVGLTLELGHVPTEDDIAAASGGCCGGGCGC